MKVQWDHIRTIRLVHKNHPYYDLTVPKARHYLAEGIYHHNTSKSVTILLHLILLCREFPGSRILICRRRRVDLSDTILNTLESVVLPMLRTPVPGGANKSNRSEYVLPHPMGGPPSFIIPLGIEDSNKLYSGEYTFAYVAEAREFTQQQVEMIGPTLRWLKSPQYPHLPEAGQCIVDTNPEAPDHWLNLKAEPFDPAMGIIRTFDDYERLQIEHNLKPVDDPENRWKRIVTRHQDNYGYWHSDRWCWTRLGQQYVERTLSKLSGFLKKRYVDGLWAASSGAVFPEYDDELLVIPDFEPYSDWPMVVGNDPGYGTTANLWVAYSPDGGYHVIDEIYEGGKTAMELGAEINRRNLVNHRNVLRYFGDPNEMFSNRAQGVSLARQYRRDSQIRFVAWPQDKGAAFDAGVDMIRQMIRNSLENIKAGRTVKTPYLMICAKCKGLRSNLASWSFKKNRSGETMEGADKYEKTNDHAADVLRGIASSQFLVRKQRELEAMKETDARRGR